MNVFCSEGCSDRCCGEDGNEVHEVFDDELAGYDVEGISAEAQIDAAPVILQPQAACASTGKSDLASFAFGVPWADLSGPPPPGCPPTSFGFRTSPSIRSHSSEQPLRIESAVSAAANAATPLLGKAPPSVNPYSRFGFITVSIPACQYKADPNDVIDIEFARHLMTLDREAALAMNLRRLAPGKYDIDGTLVDIHWGGPDSHELLVREEQQLGSGVGNGYEGAIPLSAYISQAASIAARVRRPLQPRTLTFVNQGAGDRWTSMNLACEQARLREQAAQNATVHFHKPGF